MILFRVCLNFFICRFLFLSTFFFSECTAQVGSKAISVEEFGVYPVTDIEETDVIRSKRWHGIDEAFKHCIEHGLDLYFPKGTYDIGNNNFPFRNSDLKSSTLLDCNNITIFGEGPQTILKTSSNFGADVLQLNMIKNLSFRDFSITAEVKHLTKAGSNGISVTNGFDSIRISNVSIFDLPGVDHGRYIDGGKGITLQFSDYQDGFKGYFSAEDVSIVNCAYGFRMDSPNLNNLMKYSESISINLDLNIENAFQGFSIELGQAIHDIDLNSELNIIANVALTNCQQYVRFARVIGGEYDFQVKKNNGYSPPIWNRADKRAFALLSNYTKNVKVTMKGNVGKVDRKFMIGAVGKIKEPYNLANATENSKFYFDVKGRATQDFEIIEYNGLSIRNSTVKFNKRTMKSDDLRKLKGKLAEKENHID